MASTRRWKVAVAVTTGVLVVAPLAFPQSVNPIVGLLRDAHDARTRTQAALTLGRIHPPGSREALESALDDPSASVRAAAVESLMSLADPRSMDALRAHEVDHDPGVRTGIARAIQQLGANVVVMQAPAPMATLSDGSTAGDLLHARVVLRVGTISDHASGHPAMADLMRNAIVHELLRGPDVACTVGGALNPAFEQRVRSGRVRAYALEGTLNSLRRWTVATTLSVRAEVSLVLLAHPSGTIIGSLSGAATAQDHVNDDVAASRLEERALVAAVHGAVGNLQASLH